MNQENDVMFTERLKRVIHDSGLSLPKFADQTGVSKNTLVNYRDGADAAHRGLSGTRVAADSG